MRPNDFHFFMRAAAAAAALAAPLLAAAAGAAAPAVSRPARLSPQQEEFFETQVRPVLVQNCGTCHGPQVQQGGLRLDTPAFITGKLARGAAVLVPGDPRNSPLIQVLQPSSKVKMPPQGPLPRQAVEALTEWVRQGAFWPEGGKASTGASGGHWAFRPVSRPALPPAKDRFWGRTEVDTFLLQKLRESSIRPSGYADRRTLIRRASVDLTGLPPTPEEVEAFERDSRPGAWERVVDRLLASPHYGERWARYWLDVARYADSKGYVFLEERRYPFSYTYRDYVIRSFNEDKPYDRFLLEQIAADQLEPGEDRSSLAALGFLTLGRRFLNSEPDIIDDRIDVVFRGTQGLTVGCARCHDHKYDPIPAADYYSLYGVFAGSYEPGELPLIGKPQQDAEYRTFEAELKKRQAAADQFLREQHAALLKTGKEKIAAALLATRDIALGAVPADAARKHGLPPRFVGRWVEFLKKAGEGHHPVFAPWIATARLPDAAWAEKAPALLESTRSAGVLNSGLISMLEQPAPLDAAELAARYAALLQNPGEDQQLVHALDSIGGPLQIDLATVPEYLDRAQNNKYRELKQKIDLHIATSPAAPPRAMVLLDRDQPVQPRIFKRGNAAMPGDEVPRQFLAVLSGPQRKPFQKGSGRLELARAIASPQNPLTARVMVNRVWMHHFGRPLVDTPSDFGLRSEKPSHPELLDWLSSWFVQNGWSLKKLHRLLMTSTAYMQRSDIRPEAAARDPENRLLWRMNRRRLDFEGQRDAILAVAGALDREMYGRPVDKMFEMAAEGSTRRTIYGFIDRQNLPGVMRVFDFASPDTHSPRRFETTVPQQALFLMNSPFLLKQSAALAARAAGGSEAERIAALYRIVYQREPASGEVDLARRFLASAPAGGEGPDAWQQLAQALLMTNEFTYYD